MGRLSNKQRNSNQTNTISNLAHGISIDGQNEIEQNKSPVKVQSKKNFYSRLSRSTKGLIMFGLFTNLTIIVGVLVVYFTSPKPSHNCHLTLHRMMKSSIALSSQPSAVAVNDLNNDRHIDIIVANSGTNTIGIFIANANGSYMDQKVYSTGDGSIPYSIVSSDFNHDNYVDIAVANYATNNIGIFINNQNGTFMDQREVSLDSSHPLYVSVGDFNKDNHTDLVVVNYGTNDIGILFGYGNGSFQDQLTFSTGYDSIPYSLAVTDFDNDTYLDIAVANYGTDNIIVFLRFNNGSFTHQQIYTTFPGSNPCSIAVGDFNNDNRLDIVVSNNGSSTIGIFFGYENGSFLSQTTYSLDTRSYPQYISVNDFNNDHSLDIVIIDSLNDQIHILPGYGNGTFSTITTYDTISGSRPLWLAVVDFNNNNQSDIVVANYDTNNVLLLIDYFSISSTRQRNYDTKSPSKTYSVAVNDFNNDAILDLVYTAGNDIMILIGLGNGTFNEQSAYSIGRGLYPRYVCVSDLNNDNQTDILIANSDGDNIGVFLSYGNGTFSMMTMYSTGNGSSPRWIAIGDTNHDNRFDMVSANRNTANIGIHLGHGNGTFSAMVSYFTGKYTAPESVALGDINNDNHLDVVVADWYGTVIIFVGDGTGTFILFNSFVIATKHVSIALADLNNDTHLDIILPSLGVEDVRILLGYGNGTFANEFIYPTGNDSQPYYVFIADFNNDGIYDFVVTNINTDEIVLFYGYGNGSFEFGRKYSTGLGSKPYGITVADLNNDKHLEFVVALWGSGNIAILTEYYAAQFVEQKQYPTGSAPHSYSVIIDDLNNDNRTDIVVANSGTDSLSILFSSGNGTFDNEVIYPIGTNSYPQYVLSYDVNKDNLLDLISVNSKNNSISIIMGQGNRHFSTQRTYSTGDNSHPYVIVSGDFNNDNRVDLAVANEGTDNIGLFFGFNYTSFQSQQICQAINSLIAYGVIVSDFNNDNILDIAAVFYQSNSLGVLLGYGDGTFTDTLCYSTGDRSGPVSLAVGDFNNDDRADIVVANYDNSTVGVFLGYGNVSFTIVMTYFTGNGSAPADVSVGDLNNDHQLDIIVANYRSDNFGVLLGYDNGSFAVVKLYSTGTGSRNYALIAIDVNHDHNLDVVVANSGNNNIGILLGRGDGTFQDQTTFSTGSNSLPSWIAVDDFNNDNRLDIATANWGTNNVGILLGYGNGTFTPVIGYSTGYGSSPQCISVGDFNNDVQSDIAVANYGTSSIVILFGRGDGSFLLGTPYTTGIQSAPCSLAIGDFNNDTQFDIVVADYQSSNITIFFAYDSEFFASVTTYSTGDGSQPHSIATADFNHDQKLDIVVANYGKNNLGILLGGTFDTMMTYSTGNGSAPYSVAIADFNNDTHFDIVVSNSLSDNIMIFLGYGNGSFIDGIIYSTGIRSRPYVVVTGDMNNDSIYDIIVTNSGTSNIFLLYGYGNGTFGNETSYRLGYGYHPYSIAVKDLNQDNWMDIAIACYDTDHVETLITMC